MTDHLVTGAREVLLAAFRAAVAAAQPERVLAGPLPEPPAGRTLVLALGKASVGLARAFAGRFPAPFTGLLVTPVGTGEAVPGFTTLEATHPLPSGASVRAGEALLKAASALCPDDLLVVLLSGGGSALACAPLGVTLEGKLAFSRALLACGANIGEINTVRRHLSRLKGGGLLQAANGARTVTLALSDVVGDDPAAIASGPSVPDPSTRADALAVLDRYGLEAPEVRLALARNPETLKPGEADSEYHIVGSGRIAMEAAARALEAHGVQARIWRDDVTGDAREAARAHAELARSLPSGHALLSGGETTSVVRGHGRGGRNTEFLLALALELGPGAGLYALAADTDGIDGASGGAGAVLAPDSLTRASHMNMDAQASLDTSDSGGFFAALGDLIVTGPSGTNVNDLRIVWRP